MALDVNEGSRNPQQPWGEASPWERAVVATALMPPVWVWRAPASDEILMGFGFARPFATLRECRAALREQHASSDSSGIEPRCLCVVAFDPAQEMEQLWKGFPQSQFFLPRVLVRWNSSGIAAWRCTSGNLPDTDLLKSMLSLTRTPREAGIARRTDLFARADWDAAVRSARDTIRAGEMSKVVLARAVELEANSVFDIASVLGRLAEVTDSCLFACGTREGMFLGASPERLFRLDGDILSADSLAGTRPRGRSEREDAALAAELLESSKEQGEQRQVTGFLAERLGVLCDGAHVEPLHIAKFKTVQHLRSKVYGRLRAGVGPDDVLTALHPTPAVCGNPRLNALGWIREHEPVPRGLYAGAIGWISADAAEFAVAIRSALVTGSRAHLFAGAGIVADSDPEREWEETEWKMKVMMRALVGDNE